MQDKVSTRTPHFNPDCNCVRSWVVVVVVLTVSSVIMWRSSITSHHLIIMHLPMQLSRTIPLPLISYPSSVQTPVQIIILDPLKKSFPK
ncbi:uncharacterized protein BO66DRAFT_35084 [Aspergillus aculeatinus CBS 121060]|uniref:Uncharacterized protein n=1 Tax=Aspergillus aculeatinus CBS 121060 TaxID=1448322 RepID=A0ACD1HF43_9EURO|nr:hypothetical protein BO66DRAFT_35084 [Aspergillus aculeatinus CBS 121060]RAH72412.1 hypothetical protein BO66DRAFT_35084 [Aspergillus aculeatinus CBS 121060]